MGIQRLKRFSASILVMVLFLVLSSGNLYAGAEPGSFLSITDLHFNPFADEAIVSQLIESDYMEWETIFQSLSVQKVNGMYDETNYTLLESALKEMESVIPSPDFIVLAGDFLAHDFHKRFAKYDNDSDRLTKFIYNTVGFVTEQISQQYPNTQVIFTLGNNDSYSGDYALIPNGAFLKDTAELFFDKLIQVEGAYSSFYQTYPTGGYYALNLPGQDGLRIIVVNSILFSKNYPHRQTNSKDDPGFQELAWLKEELAECSKEGKKAWILLHIPPGVDVYSSLEQNDVVLFWEPDYNQEFIQLVKDYASTVQVGFAGHTHMDDLRIITEKDSHTVASYIHITPAITPVFGNNPAFQVFNFDKSDFSLENYKTYYFNLETYSDQHLAEVQWTEEYDFTDVYQVSYSKDELLNLYSSMEADQSNRDYYVEYYSVNVDPSEIANSWKAYLYGIDHITESEFEQILMK